jgi:hypothetical protein
MDREHWKYYDHKGKFELNSNLDFIYDLLMKLGYVMSDEEKELRKGKHELFADNENPAQTKDGD